MKSLIRVLVVVSTVVLASISYASLQLPVQDISAKPFQQLIEQLHERYGDDLLVVFDDDNTLETTDKAHYGYLGGVAWYNWQSDLLKFHPDSKQLMAHSVPDLLTVQHFLFDVTPMVPTEKRIGKMISQLEYQGIDVLVETARGPALAVDTYHGFDQAHLKFNYHANASLPLFKPSPKVCGVNAAGRDARFAKGVYFVSGQNKGAMLDCLFHRLDANIPKVIVFVDDTQHNDDDVLHYFKQYYPSVNVYAVRDLHMQSVVAHFGDKEKQQTLLNWHSLRQQFISWLANHANKV